MASNGKDLDPERGTLTPEERAALQRRASEIGKRLEEVNARKAPPPGDTAARGRAFGQAYKMLIELVVGVLVGGGVGWVLDRQLGNKTPWLTMLLLVLGFAAGVSNVIRTARRMQAEAEPLQRSSPSVPDADDEDDDQPGPRQSKQMGQSAGKPTGPAA